MTTQTQRPSNKLRICCSHDIQCDFELKETQDGIFMLATRKSAVSVAKKMMKWFEANPLMDEDEYQKLMCGDADETGGLNTLQLQP